MIFKTPFLFLFLIVSIPISLPLTVGANVLLSVDNPTWELSLKHGRLTAHIHGIPLKIVLEKFHEISQIPVVVSHALDNTRVHADFANLPLETGLQQLLRGQQYTLTFSIFFHPSNSPRQTIQAIHVYQPLPIPPLKNLNPPISSPLEATSIKKGTEFLSKKSRPIPRTLENQQPTNQQVKELDVANMDKTDLKELASESETPHVRLAALEELLDRGEIADPLPFLQKELKSHDPVIREETLDLIRQLENPPLDLITNIALQDPSLDIQLAAIEQLAAELDFGSRPQPAFSALQKIALEGTQTEVRIEALEVLADSIGRDNSDPSFGPKLEQTIQQSLQDPRTAIQVEARELLAELNSMNLTK